MNRSYERERADKLALFAAFIAAVGIAGGGVILDLQKAAPIAAPASTQTAAVHPAPLPAPEYKPSPNPVAIPPPEHTAYRCVVNGTPTYSNEACAGGKAVDVTPASSGFTPQRSRATVRMAQAPPTESLSTSPAVPALAAGKAARESRCTWIEAEIERIDAAARQGQPATAQDLLGESRRKLVDEKYALKC